MYFLKNKRQYFVSVATLKLGGQKQKEMSMVITAIKGKRVTATKARIIPLDSLTCIPLAHKAIIFRGKEYWTQRLGIIFLMMPLRVW